MPVLERELSQLELGERKVEHPSTASGSKDLADALAAAVHHCEEGWRGTEGARGMFQIGIVEHPNQEIAAVYAKVEKRLDDDRFRSALSRIARMAPKP